VHARVVWAYEGEVEPGYRRAPVRRRHVSAWWIQKGSATVRDRTGKNHVARAGSWLLGGPDISAQEFSDDALILSVNFRQQWPSGDSLLRDPLVFAAAAHPALGRSARALVRFVRETFPGVRTDLWRTTTGPEEYFGLERRFTAWVEACLRALATEGAAPESSAGLDTRVRAALRELDAWPWSRPFREPDLARRVSLSPGHLDRLFVHDCGLTPRAYWQRRRLESACAALADPATPVKRVAADLGFASSAHFCRWFKKASGRTPGEERRAS
jgi:AraC-like DNA-binding protein